MYTNRARDSENKEIITRMYQDSDQERSVGLITYAPPRAKDKINLVE